MTRLQVLTKEEGDAYVNERLYGDLQRKIDNYKEGQKTILTSYVLNALLYGNRYSHAEAQNQAEQFVNANFQKIRKFLDEKIGDWEESLDSLLCEK